MNRLAFIHTAPLHAERFRDLARQVMPGWSSYAVVDESLLTDTIAQGEISARTAARLAGYVVAAAEAGAAAVVVTCSTLGPAVDEIGARLRVPLFRIDRGMAETAVRQARRIGVLATLATTLKPTTALLAQAALQAGVDCAVSSLLCEGAFERLIAGDRAAHDALVRKGFAELAATVDLVVLAQASMSDAMEADAACPYLTSPEIGMASIARQLAST